MLRVFNLASVRANYGSLFAPEAIHFGSCGSGETACRQKGQGMETGEVDEDGLPSR
jgi:hypothetical protein